ncbi:hypothetical protein SCHPADRAFT_270690 [Schizopora paradoxa]|uniref:C3H1-type domain-containing protein n=1 Tax=Schizopora paradoxa TaxID=27342 RepID=A0A0H2S0D7_9AGAM|nr:hypothetical protein SCHPADRAFT_270690 [Schizopora paradoxa]
MQKKGGKAQAYVKQVQQQAALAGKSTEERKKQAALEKQKEEIAKAKAREAEIASLVKPVRIQKVPFGVDPKTLLCEFFKAGNCEKGAKCKFSHDPNVGRKVEKRNVYEDGREEKLNDTMDKWDEEKLRSVVLSKHGNPKTTTDIVCKYFIEAIETQQFGWFWECPNGGDKCFYRHALPPGFVLKSQKKAMADAAKANEITLEDFLETERHKLGKNLTPVTPESFAKWKKTRLDKKSAEEEAAKKAKTVQAAAGKSSGMSGRDLFTYNPEWFAEEDDDDDDDWDIDMFRREKEAEELAAEEARIAALGLDDGYREEEPGDANGEETWKMSDSNP